MGGKWVYIVADSTIDFVNYKYDTDQRRPQRHMVALFHVGQRGAWHHRVAIDNAGVRALIRTAHVHELFLRIARAAHRDIFGFALREFMRAYECTCASGDAHDDPSRGGAGRCRSGQATAAALFETQWRNSV
jgi:hypothetical protein